MMQPRLLEAPEGTRDLLADGARRLRACEARVAEVFHAAHYDEVIPPTIERAELFDGVAALRTSDGAGRSLALRADFTNQVARIASSRLPGRAPLRLWYRGTVVRDVPTGRMVPRERFQCGLELLGQPEAAADAEVLSLASRALDSVGLGENVVRLSVGTTAYFAAILEHLGASKRLAHQLRDCIDRKDRAGTSALLNEVPSGTARDALAFLAAPEAQSSVLEVARRLAPNDEARAAIDRLTEVAVAARGLGDRLEIDLGEVRGLGYYTGLVFNIYAAGAPGPVGGGGRYDSLLARFGDSRPAVGFSIDLDAIAPLAMLEAR